MVAREGVEGPQLHPAQAEGGRGVAVEPTNVGPHKGHSEQGEVQDVCNKNSNNNKKKNNRTGDMFAAW